MTEKDYFGKLISVIETISSDFNSEKFYNYLNNYDGLNEYYKYCTSLDPLSSTIKYKNLRILCAQLVKYLKTTYILFNKEELKYNPCILLNYWLYSRLVNILRTEDSSVIALTLGKLELIWNDIVGHASYKSSYNKCVPDNSIVTQSDWRKRKRLYDYCVNYDSIKKIIPNFGKSCPEYWSYVESHTSLYKYFDTHCPKSNYQCPEFYKECKQYDPRDVLESFDCHAKMKQKKDEEAAANARPALPASISADQEQDSRIPGGLQSPHNGTHPTKKTGDILLGVVATSLTSGALYRFTPLGRIIRNRFGRNNNSMGNIHGGEYGLFDYASESYNPFTGGGEEHYIGYQPA
ncbi:variable surface protein Vir4, putative [Plasmodium vivax]|uniref:Variable surface protein Vir4, putative n=1 Tax=Plasmodium vivax (strain Salvador I) TaxID=126793 RepID=A5KCZ2_PLAVS|nr:variable surface protein Vir4, putative [Plasmodium vivax]EDL42777.1 variable surface protein Vir4, putative [Plasmodium vivax]|eukprot:XP_001612570.1 variable surface protein Vir4 [Plasmodium vivax Sal-1]